MPISTSTTITSSKVKPRLRCLFKIPVANVGIGSFAPLLAIGEGTNELQRIIIARQLIERNPV
jgi:alkylation response protein AidB-like acyl-CoA dehydrogenase